MQPAVVWDRSGVRRPSSEARLVPYPVLGSRRRVLHVYCVSCRDKVAGSRRIVEPRPPPHGCGGRLLGAVGNGDRKPPSRQPTAANSMRSRGAAYF